MAERRPALCAVLTLAAALAGAGLRCHRFAADRSLNGDEASLALNLLDRSFGGLRRPLADDQAAPLGFLWLERLAVVALGGSSLSLRAVPLLASLGSLAAFAVLARRLLGGCEALLAVGLFALGEPLIYYSSEVKQYGSDVLAALLLTLAALRALREGVRGPLLAAVGAGAVFVSNAAVFTAAAAATALAWRWRRRRNELLRLALAAAAWAAAMLLHVALAPAQTSGALQLRAFWSFGFVPWPPWADPSWAARTFAGMFLEPVGLGWPWLGAACFLAGTAALWRRDPPLLLLVAGPAAWVLVAAALHLFPFPTSLPGSTPMFARLVLFLTPSLLLLIAAGVGLARERAGRWGASLAVLLGLALAAAPAQAALARLRRPPSPQDLRAVVRVLAEEARAGDRVLVLGWSVFAFEFHARERPLVAGLRRSVVPPHGRRAAYAGLLDEIPGGTRAWLVVTHHPDWHSVDDEALLVRLLAARGRLLKHVQASGASAHLFCIRADACG